MIMTITSSLLGKKEMMAIFRPNSLKEKEEMVVMEVVYGHGSPIPFSRRFELLLEEMRE